MIHFDALNDVYPGNLVQHSPAATVIVNKYNMGPSSLDKESKSSFSRKQQIAQTECNKQTSNRDGILISHFRHDNKEMAESD